MDRKCIKNIHYHCTDYSSITKAVFSYISKIKDTNRSLKYNSIAEDKQIHFVCNLTFTWTTQLAVETDLTSY